MRRLLPSTALACLAIAAPAAAQGTATATPNAAGKGALINMEFDASQPPVSGRIPKDTVLSIQKGYGFQPKAVAKRCNQQQADAGKCPSKSIIGMGALQADAFGSTFTVPLSFYLAKPQVKGDLAGFVSVAELNGRKMAAFGRVVTATSEPYGISVILPTAGADMAASLGATFKSFSATIGNSRVVKKYRKVKGKRKLVSKKRFDLIKNPAVCDPAVGTWAANAVFTFSDDSTAEVASPISCTP